ncbi:WxL domain-containing protein [Enterococcus pallens]|uniref:WxL domain-containing protein n=1 Tax=Enterococcus pallens ATCC BAA-351 TaxID=1158607 RepID=R2SDD0_9ENTE|nr:WxL domain-containing protein [Enterococcus pallens]EOH90876.1 hypothetical protein UAU_03415 [Enterococcus pallens ATCC BAA-351]EOU16072.1 hypothetical protein I588_03728 [Enterococcus pallens ATCC BAA-351]
MKKISLFSVLVLSALTLGTSITQAAGTGTAADPAEGTGTVTFTENDDATDPKDPTDPTKPNPDPLPDGNNDKTDAKGPLSLDVYPSTFDFDTHKVSMSEQTYASKLTGNHYLQVTDNRDNADGWSVKVSRTEFANDQNYELTGSTFSLPAGTARNALNTPDASAEDALLSNAGAVDIPVGEGNAVTVFGADGTAKVGKSTSTYVWDAANESLTIPANVAKTGTFTSTVNWVLSAEVYQ